MTFFMYLVSLTAKSAAVIETVTAVVCPAVITGSTAETSLKQKANNDHLNLRKLKAK